MSDETLAMWVDAFETTPWPEQMSAGYLASLGFRPHQIRKLPTREQVIEGMGWDGL
jgi:hypothetical protein